MYVELDLNYQKEIVQKAVKKAESERKLSKILNIPKSSINEYKNGRKLPLSRYKNIIKFLGIDSEIAKEMIKKILDDNWKQKLGGEEVVRIKKENGTFQKNLNQLREASSLRMKKWHFEMKNSHRKRYYTIQYERFKKIGGYKFVSKRGERVRNILEKKVADMLYNSKIDYEYEKYIDIDGKVFFPDFKINNIIIECTMWDGKEKAYKLLERIKIMKKVNLNVFVCVPKKLENLYKPVDKFLFTDIDELGNALVKALVAQTDLKSGEIGRAVGC